MPRVGRVRLREKSSIRDEVQYQYRSHRMWRRNAFMAACAQEEIAKDGQRRTQNGFKSRLKARLSESNPGQRG